MELKPEQINKFIELHKDCVGFENYSEKQVREIANGIANYYLTLFKIHQRITKNTDKQQKNNGTLEPFKNGEKRRVAPLEQVGIRNL